MKKNTTKKALLLSVISIVVCLTMLVGSTFAWFTDNASTSVNRIQAGTLDIDIQDEEGNSLVGKTLDFKKAEGHTTEEILWEPGCTYELEQFKIVNKGNLALKFKLVITGINGDEKLNEAIEWGFDAPEPDADGAYHLKPEADTGMILIIGRMKEDAGNEYQGLSIEGAAITVLATQDTVEHDSYDEHYDENAAYPVMDYEAFAEAMQNGGAVNLGAPVVCPAIDNGGTGLSPLIVITKDTDMNLNGQTVSIDPAAADEDLACVPVIMSIMEPVTLTINGDGIINTEAGNNSAYAVNVNNPGAVLNITGGSFYGAPTVFQVQQGTLNISGGFFDMAPTCKAAVPGYAKYIVNCIDSHFEDDTAKINITGGTFVGFDPSAEPEGPGTSYLAPGYKAVPETHGAETWYVVVPETAPQP